MLQRCKEVQSFKDSRFHCTTHLWFISWYLWPIDTHHINFLKTPETVREIGDLSVRRYTARRRHGFLIPASEAALHWEGMLDKSMNPLCSNSSGDAPSPPQWLCPADACKPHAGAFLVCQALLPSLPSVPLFITPPCTVKPPVTLPLLLLLQIYCTCRVK